MYSKHSTGMISKYLKKFLYAFHITCIMNHINTWWDSSFKVQRHELLKWFDTNKIDRNKVSGTLRRRGHFLLSISYQCKENYPF